MYSPGRGRDSATGAGAVPSLGAEKVVPDTKVEDNASDGSGRDALEAKAGDAKDVPVGAAFKAKAGEKPSTSESGSAVPPPKVSEPVGDGEGAPKVEDSGTASVDSGADGTGASLVTKLYPAFPRDAEVKY